MVTSCFRRSGRGRDPGQHRFLHQFFSALVLVSKGANLQSGLTIKDITATIKLSHRRGPDRRNGRGAGDDPIRMAKNASGYFRGPDGV